MGNCFRTNNSVLSHIDDSVKVMIRHDAAALEKKGQKPGGYVPRAPHPILDQQTNNKIIAANESHEDADLEAAVTTGDNVDGTFTENP
jgi:hypothetical protein